MVALRALSVAKITHVVIAETLPPLANVDLAPLPGPGKSFAETERVLADRARAGDHEAAIRLFRDGDRCYQARSAEQTLQNRLTHDRLKSSDADLAREAEANLREELENLDQLQSDLTLAKSASGLCNATHDEILDGRMHWYAEQAAKAGTLLQQLVLLASVFCHRRSIRIRRSCRITARTCCPLLKTNSSAATSGW